MVASVEKSPDSLMEHLRFECPECARTSVKAQSIGTHLYITEQLQRHEHELYGIIIMIGTVVFTLQ